MRIRDVEDEHIEVQMTPLIDCVFLLLIFFLVATTLKKIDKELLLDLPVSAAAVRTPAADDTLVVSIDREGNLYLGSEPVGQGYLQDRLREVAGKDPQHRIRIDGDKAAPLQAVVQVLDMCNFEGLKNVRIKSKPETAARQ